MEYFAFQWHITDACDQRCKHCYIFSEDAGKEPDAMTWPQIQDTFYNCLDFCKIHRRLPYFYLTGGDPILHPSFWDLLGLMKENKIPFTILGNPFHLDDEVCRRLKECGCEKYQLSLDGLRETHDWFRKPGSFDCTLEKIACIKKAGIRAVIMTTVSGVNIDQIPELIDTVVAHRADVYAFARYCPTSGEKDVGIDPLRYRQLLADCDRKFKAYEAAGCETYFNKKDHLWTLYEYEMGEFHIPETAEPGVIYGGCNCGSCHLTILPTGDDTPAAGCRTAGWGTCSPTGWPTCGCAGWRSTGTLPALRSAPSASCWPGAGAVRRWPAGGMETFTPPIPSAGRRWPEHEPGDADHPPPPVHPPV